MPHEGVFQRDMLNIAQNISVSGLVRSCNRILFELCSLVLLDISRHTQLQIAPSSSHESHSRINVPYTLIRQSG